jgi:hypothetical protein
MQTVVFEINSPKITTREHAADYFCARNFSWSRIRTALDEDGRFRLDNGLHCYRVSEDGSGYLVWRL